MARPGFRNHPKFLRLVHLLNLPPAHVFGLVEFMWSVAYENGDPFLGDSTDVELAAGWTGEPGKLCAALLSCGNKKSGLVESLPRRPELFRVHDLADHAPEYVRARARMVNYRKRKRGATDAQPLRNGYGSPAPAPAPIKNPLTPRSGGTNGCAPKNGKHTRRSPTIRALNAAGVSVNGRALPALLLPEHVHRLAKAGKLATVAGYPVTGHDKFSNSFVRLKTTDGRTVDVPAAQLTPDQIEVKP